MNRLSAWAAAAALCLPALASEADSIDWLPQAERLLDEAAADGFAGSVLVARGDEVLLERQFGPANHETGMPNGPHTRFNLASLGKVFTSVAVLQLVEQGKLELDAPLGRYLPDYPEPTLRERATVRHLLDHRSGLGHYWGPEYFERRTELLGVSDNLSLFDRQPPAFEPGSAFLYSNSGYMLLGRLIEVASSMDFYDYMDQRVFRSAGMADTGYYDREGRAERVAIGRGCGPVPDRCEPRSNEALREFRGGPAGGGYSTARDLLRFRNALLGRRLLGKEYTGRMLAPVAVVAGEVPSGPGPRLPAPAYRGLGMDAAPTGGDVAFGHAGGGPGVAADFRSLRDAGLTVVLLGNIDPPLLQRTAIRLYGLLAEAGYPDIREALPMRRRPG